MPTWLLNLFFSSIGTVFFLEVDVTFVDDDGSAILSLIPSSQELGISWGVF